MVSGCDLPAWGARLDAWRLRLVRYRRLMGWIGLLLLLAWLNGFAWWLASLRPLSSDPQLAQPINAPQGADAIVVLTGGGGRITAGLELLAAGAAPRMLISGVHNRVDEMQLVRAWGTRYRKLLDCCVTLGYQAHNTMENATEVASWVQDQQPALTRIYLVTHRLHMRRALYLLNNQMPAGVTLIPYATPDPYPPTNWRFWRYAVGEYHKGLLVRVLSVGQ
jgi:uncharacterized SAM-binding protein YcdF (DUF218 family)